MFSGSIELLFTNKEKNHPDMSLVFPSDDLTLMRTLSFFEDDIMAPIPVVELGVQEKESTFEISVLMSVQPSVGLPFDHDW